MSNRRQCKVGRIRIVRHPSRTLLAASKLASTAGRERRAPCKRHLANPRGIRSARERKIRDRRMSGLGNPLKNEVG